MASFLLTLVTTIVIQITWHQLAKRVDAKNRASSKMPEDSDRYGSGLTNVNSSTASSESSVRWPESYIPGRNSGSRSRHDSQSDAPVRQRRR
jgi:hypothetical protein